MNIHAPHREDSSPPGALLVLGSGPQAEWEPAMQRLAADGPLLFIDDRHPSWQRPHLADARTASLLEPRHVAEETRKFGADWRIAGVLHFHPAHTRAAALIRQEFGLAGPSAAAVEASTLRHRTAELLARAGVDHSGTIHADHYDQAVEAAHHVGFPLLCKPASPRKRYAARHVAGLPQLAEAFSAATAATWPGTGTVIEPLLDGIEATAYTTSSTSGPRLVAVSHATFDLQAEPAVIPLEVVVDAGDVCAPAVEDLALRALAALGHDVGPAQIRMRITATGPRVISVTTHLTDPLACMLIEQATGIDLIAEAGACARGQTAGNETEPVRLGATAVRFLQGPPGLKPPRTAALAFLTPYATLHPYAAAHHVGPLHRNGHLMVSGVDFPQCVARLRSAVGQLRTERLPA